MCLLNRGIRLIADLPSPEAPLSALTNLDLTGNDIATLSPLHLLTSLRVLVLDGNRVRSLGIEVVLDESGRFTASGDAVATTVGCNGTATASHTDAAASAGETSASGSAVCAGGVHTADSPSSGPVVVFPSLQVLSLASNMLTDVQPLELWRFPELRTLFLQSNLLSSTAGIALIPTLQHAVLDRNRIRCVGAGTLDTCKQLRELHLVANRVTTLEGVDRIAGLERLRLSSNKLTQMDEVTQVLSKLPRLEDVALDHNPVARGVGCESLPRN